MSGAASHRVDLGALDGFVGDLAAFDSAVEARLADLDAQMQRLHATWEGDAAVAQKAAHAELVTGLQEMRTALSNLRQAARTAHGNYEAAMAANQGMFGGLA